MCKDIQNLSKYFLLNPNECSQGYKLTDEKIKKHGFHSCRTQKRSKKEKRKDVPSYSRSIVKNRITYALIDLKLVK